MSVLIATPCYAGGVTAQHMGSCLQLSWALDKAGISHDWDLGWNESLVHRARMEMCAKYLRQSEFQFLCWIDADIQYTPENFADLWNMDADIAVGVYMMKKPTARWYSAWVNGKLVDLEDCPKEPFEVDYAGTGFMMIKRSAIDKIIAHIHGKHLIAKQLIEGLGHLSPRNKVVADEMVDAMAWEYQGNVGRVPALFKTPTYMDGLESEDYHFCRIAREAGLKVMMNPNVRLTHWGQYPYGAATAGDAAANAT